MTENNSVADLSGLPATLVHNFNKEYNTNLNPKKVLYFNRLKATKYRIKEGTLLMVEILKLVLKYKYSIICDINPYNNSVINLEQLVSFYKSFGFKKVSKSTMIYI